MQVILNATPAPNAKQLGDLYGIFFEDLNHAADGGLYAELIQNRSFEFDPIDNKAYHSLTAWEIVRPAQTTVAIATTDPLHQNNPHFARLTVQGQGGLRNLGYNTGICLQQGEHYHFTCYLRLGTPCKGSFCVRLESSTGDSYVQSKLTPSTQGWCKVEAWLTAPETDHSARLCLLFTGQGSFDVDFVSLFPKNTFRQRENGMRADLAQLLCDMQPKFMRFPGGCLTHCGSLDETARDSMYRWKNTIGPVEARPARANNWSYNQSLGIGFYEYFLFCEDIGATPLPVLPGGYNPHSREAVPLTQMQPWIQDALDLIDFANGSTDTYWGNKRAALGHPEPFSMVYLGIGNEEVGQDFFDRYALFHKAIRQAHPEIKLINSSGPFCAGGEYDRGWNSAQLHGSDYVDEHYYQSPQWFLANVHRYDHFDPQGPKVFLGEYATWGNSYYNALAEAAFLTGMEKAPAVGLACYAPMLANVDYVNWQPDMVWFNNHQAWGSANYVVQKLFMLHQGDILLPTTVEAPHPTPVPQPPIAGAWGLSTVYASLSFHNIVYHNLQTDQQECFCAQTLSPQTPMVLLGNSSATSYCISFTATVLSLDTESSPHGNRGFRLFFGKQNDANHFYWELGGWQNQDAMISAVTAGKNSTLVQHLFALAPGQSYQMSLQVTGRSIKAYINGALLQETTDNIPVLAPLYTSGSLDTTTGERILKVVNVQDCPVPMTVSLQNLPKPPKRLTTTWLAGYLPEAENTAENPQHIQTQTTTTAFYGNCFPHTFPPQSITMFRIG